MKKTIPGATLQGTYSTYRKGERRSFNKRLGNVVEFKIEDKVHICQGSWFSGISITALPGTKVDITNDKDGSVRFLISR
jgi:hypothetical protein